jgi:hypothetical protein
LDLPGVFEFFALRGIPKNKTEQISGVYGRNRSSMFQEGGPHDIRRTGKHTYTMKVSFPKDAEGRTARACPSNACLPDHFKIKNGTGIAGAQESAYCPYCRHAGEPNDFLTKSQMTYAQEIMAREAHPGIARAIKDALGIGPSGKRIIGGGLLSLELSVKAGAAPSVYLPFEEAMERVVVCPQCLLEHAVFGLAVWCPDCGQDIFMAHVEAEFSVTKTMLSDLQRRRDELGSRVASRDLGNCLEDVVTNYEAVLRAMLVRSLRAESFGSDKIREILRPYGSRLQNVRASAEIFQKVLSFPLLDHLQPAKVAALIQTFEKRHPITRNLGIVDRKYLERLQSSEHEGREIRVRPEDISAAIKTVLEILEFAYKRLFVDDKQRDKRTISNA